MAPRLSTTLGRIKRTEQNSERGLLTVSHDYADDFVKYTTDARGHKTRTTFQPFDQPTEDAITSITAPAPLEGVVVNIARDYLGKPTSITRSGYGKSAARKYLYDAKQRLCKTIEPETGATVQESGSGAS